MSVKKRGQITLFIILGIVILIIVGVFIYISSNVMKVKERAGAVDNIEEYMKSCIEASLISAKEECFGVLTGDFAGSDGIYIIEEFENCVKTYMNGDIYVEGESYGGMDCSRGLEIFEGYNIEEYGDKNVNVNVVSSSDQLSDWNLISVSVNYPIKIMRGSEEYRLDQFYAEVRG